MENTHSMNRLGLIHQNFFCHKLHKKADVLNFMLLLIGGLPPGQQLSDLDEKCLNVKSKKKVI
jgi:hypothetical protein